MKKRKLLLLVMCILALIPNGKVNFAADVTEESATTSTEESPTYEEIDRWMFEMAPRADYLWSKGVGDHGDIFEEYEAYTAWAYADDTGVKYCFAVYDNPDGAKLVIQLYAYDRDGEMIAYGSVCGEGVTEITGYADCRWGGGKNVGRVVIICRLYGGESELEFVRTKVLN